jgi:hypothetical protein
MLNQASTISAAALLVPRQFGPLPTRLDSAEKRPGEMIPSGLSLCSDAETANQAFFWDFCIARRSSRIDTKQLSGSSPADSFDVHLSNVV